ncbi:Oidioi.mRNA.OKI2018_I69.PAR.g9583.t1.cds [Oikopleura dioica]|uniref:Oidioi.mRNA.OKI2018_I69.PAR.g9583.t1.cds n=1 Tax=Oikopleura dioica TaxID=34765 RepID=A0ABN7RLE2_OIKDI|nr:Oidioi.mRNA.OKI2018_I69.PAR.g9583.t1.cds [Oikopleura dioica]
MMDIGTTGLLSACSNLLSVFSDAELKKVFVLTLDHIDHKESRVRSSSAALLADLVKKLGEAQFFVAFGRILELIRRDLARDPGAADLPQNEVVRQKILEGQKSRGLSSQEIFHESAGWRHLETSMNGMKLLFEKNDPSKVVSQELFDLLNECTCHSNRFIRESAFYIASAILSVTLENSDLVPSFASLIHKGISDNWSQVRMASSTAARAFLKALNEEERAKYYSLLLPPICINRYYIAAGVRIHNQETWRLLFPEKGVQVVESNIASFTSFYSAQIAADNHAVREAACACIAELASKCSPASLEGQWEVLLDSLIKTFGDDSWPVRDACCIAAGNFVSALPEQTFSKHQVLYEKFMENVIDPIASVRQGGAVAVAKLLSVNGEVFPKVVAFLEESFKGLKDQSENNSKFGRLEPGPGQFGVVRRIQQDEDKQENGTMYSCGSLAPKMKAKQPTGGGCSSCTSFTRKEEPWERADGSLILLVECAKVSKPNQADEICRLFALGCDQIRSNRHFDAHQQLHETFSKQISLFAEAVGKKTFKNCLVGSFDILFYAANSPVLLTKAAAEECLASLSKLLGPSILRGRAEMTHPDNLETLDRALNNPMSVPQHQVTGMRTAEDNYGAFIGMAPGRSY